MHRRVFVSSRVSPFSLPHLSRHYQQTLQLQGPAGCCAVVFMFLCCCVRLHRHQLHLASYGFVSMSLIVTGFVFTVFAIFHRDTPIEPTTANSASGPTAAITEKKDEQNDQPWDWIGHSRLGKIWLAGPVLMVVGGVLCGKVMIDWGPAMARGRRGSLDSQLMDELVFANLLPIDGAVAKAARASLIMAHSEAEPSKLMRTARFSCTSAASVSSSTAAAIDHFLLASSAGTTAGGGGAVVGVPNHYNLSCPLLPPSWPPPMCALYGSSSSASSINSQKNGGCNFDRIIYGPLDHQQMLNDNEEADEQIENGTRNNDNGNDQIRQKSNNTNNCNANTLDKSTQSEEQWGDCAADSSSYGCERCATFWPILERKRNNDSEKTQERQEEEEERPKVIGKFVFAQLLEKRAEGGGGRKSPNYGTILTGHNGDDHPQQLLMDHNNVDCERMERRTMNDVKETSSQNKTNNSNNNSNRRTSRACCSQGETLIINERSFLI